MTQKITPSAVNLFSEVSSKATYRQIKALQARGIINKILKDNLQELSTFCPEGWTYNEHHFLNPISDALLGACPGNGLFSIQTKENALYPFEGKWFYPEITSSKHREFKNWVLNVIIQEHHSKKTGASEIVGVRIPHKLLKHIKALIFGNNQKILVQWYW